MDDDDRNNLLNSYPGRSSRVAGAADIWDGDGALDFRKACTDLNRTSPVAGVLRVAGVPVDGCRVVIRAATCAAGQLSGGSSLSRRLRQSSSKANKAEDSSSVLHRETEIGEAERVELGLLDED